MNEPAATAERLTKLRDHVQQRERLLRLINQEVENFEDLEDGRSALVEHLVFERRNLAEGDAQRGAEAEAELRRLTERLERLRAAVVDQEAVDQREQELAALQRQLGEAAQQAEQLHARCKEEEEALQRQIGEETERAESYREEIEDTARKVEEVERQLRASIEEVQFHRKVVGERQDELNQSRAAALAELDKRDAEVSEALVQEQRELEQERRGMRRIEQRIERIEARHHRVRERVHQLQEVIAALGTTTRPPAARDDPAPASEEPEADLPASASEEPEADLAASATFEVDLSAAAALEAELPVTRMLEPDLPATTAPEAERPAVASETADSAPPAKPIADVSSLGKRAFKARLYAGEKIVCTSRFTSATVVSRIDIEMCRLLETADTLKELNMLAPTALRRDLIDLLYRFYQTELISLASDS